MVNTVPIAIVCALVAVLICVRLIMILHRRNALQKTTFGTQRSSKPSLLGKLATSKLVFPHHESTDVLPRTQTRSDIASAYMAEVPRTASVPVTMQQAASRPAVVLRTCSDPGRPPTPPPRFELVGPSPPKFEEVIAIMTAEDGIAAAARSGFGLGTEAVALPPPAYSPRA